MGNKTLMSKKMKEMKEIWRDIPNYEGYQASNMGNIRSLNRTVVFKDGRERFYKGRVFDGYIDKKDGYRRFTLSINGESRGFTASQLIAITFLNHISDGHTLVVDHVNGNRLDDRVENLRIVTNRANNSYCYRSDRSSLSSKFTGVYWSKHAKKWHARIRYEGKQIHLGYFSDELKAYQAYKKTLSEINNGVFNSDEKIKMRRLNDE